MMLRFIDCRMNDTLAVLLVVAPTAGAGCQQVSFFCPFFLAVEAPPKFTPPYILPSMPD